MLGAQHTIGELKVYGSLHDNAALRLALSRDLDQAFQHPRGLPPTAVLLIRSLADPLPGSLGVHSSNRQQRALWNRALRNRLEELLESACTPNESGVVANGDSVLFTEQSQMIAAIALTLVNGRAQPWWCKILLRRFTTIGSSRLLGLLGRQPEYIPAVFDVLDQWRVTQAVADLLTEKEAAELVILLIVAFNLTALSTQLQQTERDPTRSENRYAVKPSISTDEGIYATDDGFQWSSHIIEGQPRVAGLVQLALTVQRRLDYARSATFAECFAFQWADTPKTELADKQSIPNDNTDRIRPKSSQPPQTQKQGRYDLQNMNKSDSVQLRSLTNTFEFKESGVAHDGFKWIAPVWEERQQGRDDGDLPVTRPVSPELGKVGATQTPDRSELPIDDLVNTAPESRLNIEADRTGVPTEWGGVLYLINLLEHLNIPACFERDWDLEQSLGPWLLLELLGCALLGDEALTDGLWATLLALDGRDAHAMTGGSHGLTSRPDYLIPIDWIAADGSGTDYPWHVNNGRLCIWRHHDYVVYEGSVVESRPVNQAINQMIRLQLRPEALRYGRVDNPVLATPMKLAATLLVPDTMRWLLLVVPYLQYRLRLASGDQALDIAQLLRCPGRLYVDRTHVELVAGLESVNLLIRRAGLDRDPGWQPRYGRVIAFRFE